jgi:hypothetical protein
MDTTKEYEYTNNDVPEDRNFIDIEGPDGLLSHADVLRIIVERDQLRETLQGKETS